MVKLLILAAGLLVFFLLVAFSMRGTIRRKHHERQLRALTRRTIRDMNELRGER